MAVSSAIRTRQAKPPRYPYSIEIKYASILRKLVRELRLIAIQEIKLHGEDLIQEFDKTFLRSDRALSFFGFGASINDVIGRISSNIAAFTATAINHVSDISSSLNFFHRRDFERQANQAYGRNKNSPAPAFSPINISRAELTLAQVIAAWEQNNITLISSIPTVILDQLKFELNKAFTTGTSLTKLLAIVEDRSSVGEIRAALIARDQIGSLNGQLSEIRQRAAGINSFVWRTMQDERVRQTHRIRDYKTFKWDDPGIKPGSERACRCVASPVFPDYNLLIK